MHAEATTKKKSLKWKKLNFHKIKGSATVAGSFVYFQNSVQQGDMAALKGIYNLLCGIGIILSGIFIPQILLRGGLGIFLACMTAVFLSCLVLVKRIKQENACGD